MLLLISKSVHTYTHTHTHMTRQIKDQSSPYSWSTSCGKSMFFIRIMSHYLRLTPFPQSSPPSVKFMMCSEAQKYCVLSEYKTCSKNNWPFTIKNLLLILQHFKHCCLQSSPLYWCYTVPNISSIVGMLPGTPFLWWRAVFLSHLPESPLWFGNNILSKWF